MTVMALSDLCSLVAQQVDPQSSPDDLYLGLEHLASGRMTSETGGKAREVQSSKYRFQPDDVLYGKLRPYLDKAVLADVGGVCTTELLVLRPKPNVDARYLAAVVHSPQFIEHAVAGTTGAQHPRTSWHHIAEFSLERLEPIEQSRFADFVWQVHRTLRASEAALSCAQELKRATMRELFTRGLRGEVQKDSELGPVPVSWGVERLGDVSLLERGRFLHRPRNEPRFYGGKTPFVQTGDVVRSGGRICNYSQTLNDDGVAISRVFPRGTILVTIAANIGYTGILEMDCACPDSLVGITASDRISATFLEQFLRSQQSEMDRKAPIGTQKNINIEFLRPWPIALPSLEEQQEITSILDAIDAKIDLHKRKKAVLEELFRALLHKLMTGEIRVADLDLSALDGEVTG